VIGGSVDVGNRKGDIGRGGGEGGGEAVGTVDGGYESDNPGIPRSDHVAAAAVRVDRIELRERWGKEETGFGLGE
jgi:hypothetical protein